MLLRCFRSCSLQRAWPLAPDREPLAVRGHLIYACMYVWEQERRIAAFNFFVRDMVEKIRKENPQIDHQQCMKIIGEAWRRLSKEERSKW